MGKTAEYWDSFLYFYLLISKEFQLIYLNTSHICDMFSDLTSRVGVYWQQLKFVRIVRMLCVRVFTVSPAASSWIFQTNFPRGKKKASKACLLWYYFLLSLCLSVEPRRKGWWIKNQSWGRTRNTTAEFCKWWWEWHKMLFRHHTCCFGDKPSVTDDCTGKIHCILVSEWYLCSALLLQWHWDYCRHCRGDSGWQNAWSEKMPLNYFWNFCT